VMGLVTMAGAQPIPTLLRGWVAWGLVFGVAAYVCRMWVRQLGGLTGDTYGALNEIGEVVALAAMSATVG
jgi:adenosylcobinamide-GDP ribazoletransferase